MPALTDQVALVTGGGTGIGRMTAKLLAAEGAKVVVAGRTKATLEAVVGEIARDKGTAAARVVDVGDPHATRELAAWVEEHFRRVDVLVNNAGLSSHARSVRWITQKDWEQVVAINLNGVFALTQAVLPGMLQRGSGTIITVSSLAGLRPSGIAGPAYGAAKAAAINFMGTTYLELRARGIRCTSIVPAEVDTPILDKRPAPPDATAKATMMQPEDVARAILLAVTLPPRTTIEEIVLSPTRPRDMTAEIEAGRRAGAPPDGN